MPAVVGVASSTPLGSSTPIVQNLLFYPDEQSFMDDQLIQSSPFAATNLVVQVTVFQFGLQSTGVWVEVICPLSDPTSFAPNLALQYFPDSQYIGAVNPFYIQDLHTLSIPGFFLGVPLNSNAQALLGAFQSLGTYAGSGAALTSTVVEMWYLLGYPDQRTMSLDGNLLTEVGNSGGVQVPVTVYGGSSSARASKLGGVWVLVKIPGIVDTQGTVALNPNLRYDGFLRLIINFTAQFLVESHFHTTKYLRIQDSSGALLFDGLPLPGVIGITPSAAPNFPPPPGTIPDNPYVYIPQGLHFDGATGLVTAEHLVTTNSGQISFAGWFNIDPSLTGTGNKLEFSQGDGSGDQLFIDTSTPGPTWCHLMGTIDAVANQSVLLLNGQQVGTTNTAGTLPFNDASNGKLLNIGTDTLGNFFIGDIADLSIWFDTSWISPVSGTIPRPTIANFITQRTATGGSGAVVQIGPLHPAEFCFGFNRYRRPFYRDLNDAFGSTNVLFVKHPDVFLSGPASNVGPTGLLRPRLPPGVMGPYLAGVLDLQVSSGALTNSATNPGKINLQPA